MKLKKVKVEKSRNICWVKVVDTHYNHVWQAREYMVGKFLGSDHFIHSFIELIAWQSFNET